MPRPPLLALLLVLSASACSGELVTSFPTVPAQVRAALSSVHAQWGSSALSTPGQKRASIAALVEAYRVGYNISGLAVGVVQDGNTVAAAGFGSTGRDDGRRVDADTVFSIGSTTKAFTATLVGHGVDQGEFGWDTPLWAVAKGRFKMMDAFASERVSMRDLCSMRFGLPFGGHDFAAFALDQTRADLVYRVQFAQPNADFRSKFQYCNVGPMTAGFLAAEQRDTSWEALVKTVIFDKLGMSRSFTKNADVTNSTDNYAMPHVTLDDGVSTQRARPELNDLLSPLGGAGMISSTANDMVKWLKFNLKTPLTPTIVSASTLDEIHSSQTAVQHWYTTFRNAFNPSQLVSYTRGAYAMGWGVGTYRQNRIVQHNGALFGMNAQVSLLPDRSAGAFVVANRNAVNQPLYELTMAIFDILLGLEPWVYPESKVLEGERGPHDVVFPPVEPHFCASAKPRRKVETSAALPLPKSAYARTFYHPYYGRLFVSESSTSCQGSRSLYAQLGQALGSCVQHTGSSVFTGRLRPTMYESPIDFMPMVITFTVTADLDVTAASIPFDTSYDPILFTTENWTPGGVGYSTAYSAVLGSGQRLFEYDKRAWQPRTEDLPPIQLPERRGEPARAPSGSKSEAGGMGTGHVALLVIGVSVAVALATAASCVVRLRRQPKEYHRAEGYVEMRGSEEE